MHWVEVTESTQDYVIRTDMEFDYQMSLYFFLMQPLHTQLTQFLINFSVICPLVTYTQEMSSNTMSLQWYIEFSRVLIILY